MAYIDVSKKGTNYITVFLNGLDTNWNSGERRVIWFLNGINKGGVDLLSLVSSGGILQFTGLNPNTVYKVDAEILWKNGSYYETLWDSRTNGGSINVTTSAYWQWSFSTISGSDFNLTAYEWLNFQTAINKMRTNNGKPIYPFTTDSYYISSGKDFTAWEFLQAVNAIHEVGQNVAPQLRNVESGDDIYGWYFEHLATALNSI